MSLGLMLHCGAVERDREIIKNIPTPQAMETPRINTKTGEQTGTSVWQPVSHEMLTRLTEKTLQNSGFEIKEQQFGVSPDGARFFGLMEIAGNNLDGNGAAENGYKRLLGLRNSFDKSFAAGLACGAHVIVCDNLSFSGEVTAKHKHTRNIVKKLPGLILEAISKIPAQFEFQDKRIEAYKNESFDQFKLGDTLIELIRNGAIPSGRVAVDICDEFKNPRQKCDTDSKVWNLFNATTEVLKKIPQAAMLDRTIKLHRHLDKICDVKWKDITECDRIQAEIDQEQNANFALENN